jgi:hypothetical protein
LTVVMKNWLPLVLGPDRKDGGTQRGEVETQHQLDLTRTQISQAQPSTNLRASVRPHMCWQKQTFRSEPPHRPWTAAGLHTNRKHTAPQPHKTLSPALAMDR